MSRADLVEARTRNCGLRKTGYQERRPLDLERLQRDVNGVTNRNLDSSARGRGR